MKRALAACLTLLFLGVFMTPGQAQAHGGQSHGTAQPRTSASVSDHQDVAYKDAAISVTAKDIKNEAPCNGGCCSGKFMSCCVSAAALPLSFDLGYPRSLKDAYNPSQSDALLPSDPDHQFRPPRLSA